MYYDGYPLFNKVSWNTTKDHWMLWVQLYNVRLNYKYLDFHYHENNIFKEYDFLNR